MRTRRPADTHHRLAPQPARHRPTSANCGYPGGVDSRTHTRLLPPTAAARAGNRGAAGFVGLAAVLALAGVAAPPRLATSSRLVAADTGCGVPGLASTADLAGTVGARTATVLAYPRAARPVLHDLAQRIAPTDCEETTGRFHVVRHRTWHLHTDGKLSTRDVVRWYAEDNSGAALTAEYPDPWPGVARDFWPPGWLHDKNLFQAFSSADFLRAQAGSQTTQLDSPQQILAGVAELATWHSPRRPGRAIATKVLADTPGLTAYPRTVDRAGRTGIGVAATSGDGHTRRLLILHPTTGQVLAYERAVHTPTGWQAHSYLLLLTRTHAERRWWEPPPPTAADDPTQPAGLMLPRRQGVSIIPADQPCTTDTTTTPEGTPS